MFVGPTILLKTHLVRCPLASPSHAVRCCCAARRHSLNLEAMRPQLQVQNHTASRSDLFRGMNISPGEFRLGFFFVSYRDAVVCLLAPNTNKRRHGPFATTRL